MGSALGTLRGRSFMKQKTQRQSVAEKFASRSTTLSPSPSPAGIVWGMSPSTFFALQDLALVALGVVVCLCLDRWRRRS